MTLPAPTRFTAPCTFPSCEAIGTEKHHITYNPEVTKWLCKKHHEEITAINSVEARRFKYKQLSNKHRWFLWFQWIEGKLKPRRSHLTKAWNAGLMCLGCGSRSLKYSRTWGQWQCKSCDGCDIGTQADFEKKQAETAEYYRQLQVETDKALAKSKKRPTR